MTYEELCINIINDFEHHYSNYLEFDGIPCMPLYLENNKFFYQPYPILRLAQLAGKKTSVAEGDKDDIRLTFPAYREVPVLETGFRELLMDKTFEKDITNAGFTPGQTLNVLLPVHIPNIHNTSSFSLFGVSRYRTQATIYRIYRPYFPDQKKNPKMLAYGNLGNGILELDLSKADRLCNLLTLSYDTARTLYKMDEEFMRSIPYDELTENQKSIVERRLSIIAALKLEQII